MAEKWGAERATAGKADSPSGKRVQSPDRADRDTNGLSHVHHSVTSVRWGSELSSE